MDSATEVGIQTFISNKILKGLLLNAKYSLCYRYDPTQISFNYIFYHNKNVKCFFHTKFTA